MYDQMEALDCDEALGHVRCHLVNDLGVHIHGRGVVFMKVKRMASLKLSR